MSNESSTISRRDFMQVSARYGMTGTLLSAGTPGAGATVSQLANAAAETDAKHYNAMATGKQSHRANRRYMPGPRTRGMVLDVISNRARSAPRHAILQAPSDEAGETCNCTMLDGDHRVYFDHVEVNRPYRIQLPPGSQLPLQCTSSGKLFLAHMQPRVRRRLSNATPLKRFTKPERLTDELKRIAKDGIGIDDEELMTGMVGVAVPVFKTANEICFTVAVHAPAVRKPLEALRQYVPSLRRAAATMAAAYCRDRDNDA